MYGKKSLFLLLTVIIAAILPSTIRFLKPYLEERLPDVFSVEKIAMDVHEQFPHFETPDLSSIAGQEFHYLGHGGQAVAFASEDDRYVLKFFLTRLLHGKKKFAIPKPTHWIPSHRKARHKKREEVRIKSLMKALSNYALAFEKIKEKTGIIGLHLQATNENLPTITLLDQQGQKHQVDLNRASFVFQHKAQLVKDKLSSATTEEQKMRIVFLINQFFEERARAGFIDVERSFMINLNYGFLNDQPIQLDVGNIEFLEEQKKSPEAEICRIQGMLRNWAKEHQLPTLP